MLQYREFFSLTDEEIKFFIKDIFPHTKDVNIERYERSDTISCDIYYIEKCSAYIASLYLSSKDMRSRDFTLTDKELLKWKQFLLAKGCDYRLKDNPYMKSEEI